MRVKMLVAVSGLRDGQPWPPPGGSMDLPDNEAAALCEHHLAVPVYDPESGVERAVVSPAAVEARDVLVPGRTAKSVKRRG